MAEPPRRREYDQAGPLTDETVKQLAEAITFLSTYRRRRVWDAVIVFSGALGVASLVALALSLSFAGAAKREATKVAAHNALQTCRQSQLNRPGADDSRFVTREDLRVEIGTLRTTRVPQLQARADYLEYLRTQVEYLPLINCSPDGVPVPIPGSERRWLARERAE